MFATSVIVFREVFEAALLIGIIAAATQRVPGRNRWLAAGIVAGLLGSALVAASTSSIAEMAEGLGQEIFNASVLGFAVLMLAWHNVWMASHSAALAADVRAIGSAIRDGRRECSVLFVVVGLAVLREGAETVLFLYGVSTAEGGGSLSMLLGGLIGAGAGMLTGYAVYAGLLRIPLRWLFAATSTLVLLLAAGMASQAARFLIQADLLPSLASPLWDASNLLPQSSLWGSLLHSLIGYEDRPSGMQMVFYLSAMLGIALGMNWAGKFQPSNRTRKAS